MCMYSVPKQHTHTHLHKLGDKLGDKPGDKRGEVAVGLSKNFALLHLFTKPATEEVPLDRRYMRV